MAIGPIDYLGAMPQTNFLQSIQSGLQLGLGIRQVTQAEEEKARALQAQEQYKAEVSQYLAKPTAQGAAALATKYPSNREAILEGWKTVDSQQQKDEITAANEVYAALTNGRTDVATQRIEQRIAALDASGGDSTEEKALLGMLKENPTQATGYLGLVLAQLDDKFAANHAALGQERRATDAAPAGLRKANAEATTAEVAAGNAEERTALENERIAEDIRDKKDLQRIRSIEAAYKKEDNEIKREELRLKLDDAKLAREEKLRAKGADAETAISDVDNTVGILKDILGDEDTLRAAVGTSAWRGAIPGTKARTMAGKIEQLQNAIASTNLDKLKGAMSDKDIMFLKNIATNLDRYQDEDLFIKELNRVFGALEDARERVVQKFGAAGTPTAEGETVFENHPKYGKVTERRLRLLARKSGVSVEEAKAFLSNSIAPGQGATGEY